MKLFTPEISWHQKEPIFSVDFCPTTWKLASCGADFTVKIWLMKEKENNIGIEFLSNLDRHAKPVNVVRFSPNGNLLASAGDDGVIILWKLNEADKSSAPNIFGDEDQSNKENWTVHKMLRGHIEDVYDLAWSPDSSQLITGSVDNSAIVWDVVKGQNLRILTDHKHYVQGVCWDPRNFYIATHSSDRTCRLYNRSNYKCCYNIHRNTMSYKKDGQSVKSKLSRMFLDETMQSFFRRCTFSPDGSFLFLPAGLCDGDPKPRKTTYVFARGHYGRPIRQLPGNKKATVCVKCSPIVYELIEDKENGNPVKQSTEYFKVPYRIVYAVASLDAITFYDTQHDFPIGYCANMHYASLTDISWSSDGRFVVVSSTDGYCSVIMFDKDELGVPICFNPIEYQMTQAKIRQANKKESVKKEKKKENEVLKVNNTEEKKLPATPVRTENAKEVPKSQGKSDTLKYQTKLDRNQPTIEKLFVTPVRKRKRMSETSPSACAVKRDAPLSQDREDTQQRSNEPDVIMLSPSTPSTVVGQSNRVDDCSTKNIVSDDNGKLLSPKQAKRVTVTTLQTFDKASPAKTDNSDHLSPFKTATERSQIVASVTPTTSKKPPKRVSVTTLCTFNNENVSADKTEINKLTIPENKNTANLKSTPVEKKPKRVQVTTLCSFGKQDVSKNQTTTPCAECVNSKVGEQHTSTSTPTVITID